MLLSLFIIVGRSFMYFKKNSGRRIELWGTPQFILTHFEELVLWSVLLSVTFWYVLVKYDSINVLNLPFIP